MQIFFSSLIIFAHSLVAFLGLYVFYLVAKDWSRWTFTLSHWLAVAVIFFIVYLFYVKVFQPLTAFQTMTIAMVSIFIIEFIVYTFLAKGELWFLNYYDYVVSVFIAASVVYWVVNYFNIK